jgi:hypothetical protein
VKFECSKQINKSLLKLKLCYQLVYHYVLNFFPAHCMIKRILSQNFSITYTRNPINCKNLAIIVAPNQKDAWKDVTSSDCKSKWHLNLKILFWGIRYTSISNWLHSKFCHILHNLHQLHYRWIGWDVSLTKPYLLTTAKRLNELFSGLQFYFYIHSVTRCTVTSIQTEYVTITITWSLAFVYLLCWSSHVNPNVNMLTEL